MWSYQIQWQHRTALQTPTMHMWHLNRSAGKAVDPFLFCKADSAANSVHETNKGKPQHSDWTFITSHTRASVDVTNHMNSPWVSLLWPLMDGDVPWLYQHIWVANQEELTVEWIMLFRRLVCGAMGIIKPRLCWYLKFRTFRMWFCSRFLQVQWPIL